MIVPILMGFFYKGKKSPLAGLGSMIAGSTTSLIWVIHGYMNAVEGWPMYIEGIEPLYPGLLMSLLVFVIINVIQVRRMK